MPIKLLPVLMASTLLLGLQANFCNRHENDDRVEWGGPNKTTNLVIFFKQGTTSEEVQEFNKSILNMDENPLAFRFRVLKGDHEGVGVNFSVNATPEQRESLSKSIEESPIVYKVFENVVPSDVKLK